MKKKVRKKKNVTEVLRNLLVRNPKLNSCDRLLPKLPIPALSDTVEKYLESVEPLCDEEEYKNICQLASNFLKNEGPKLQLYTHIWGLFNSNYVTPFWEKYAYLMNREGLMITSSVAHIDLFKDAPANQAVRAAHVMYIEALSMLAIAKQQLKPLADGLVCSTHYHKMYANTRVPEEGIDHLDSHKLSKHVVVYSKGCFYKVDLFDQNNRLFSTEQLSEVLTEILVRKDIPKPGEEKLAALTFDSRASWCKNRKRFFLENCKNKKALELIEKAMVFLIMDENDTYEYIPEKPEILDNFLKSMLTGDGKNRWVDKSLNYIVAKNGRAGGTTEHSIADGAEFDHIMENFCAMDINFLTYPQEVVDIDKLEKYEIEMGATKAQKLEFDISDEMIGEIERCYAEHQPKKDDVDFAATIFRDFGKGLVKKGKCSPDAFVQMAIQLANYKDQGKFSLTYESASARFYANSRTETLRTVSKDSCAFVKAMLDVSSNDQGKFSLTYESASARFYANSRTETLRTVSKDSCAFVKAMLDESSNGIDRHLFALYVLSRGSNTSSPFLDHYISQQWLLSTSQPPTLTNQVDEDANIDHSWLGACFAAVAKDGYGICYRFAGNHSICAHITSYKSSDRTDSHRFQKNLIEAFHSMAKLFETEGVTF
uniref:Choline/carnitine acyltransferase domain-containing protein n=1 Tax=Panagrolaimus sp. ES5 TaxID=591445 RepID=A0AC34FEK9_9BILA